MVLAFGSKNDKNMKKGFFSQTIVRNIYFKYFLENNNGVDQINKFCLKDYVRSGGVLWT